MAIPSRQIGWGTESNLLWQILKQLTRLTSVIFSLKEAATPKYKVFSALISQTGGTGDELFLNTGVLAIGVSYTINLESVGMDFTNVGAPDNNVGTSFIATAEIPNSWGVDEGVIDILVYYDGAPFVESILENTIGNVWFTYKDVGHYVLTSNSLFTERKTSVILSTPYFGENPIHPGFCVTEWSNLEAVSIYTMLNDTTLSNYGLLSTFIEVRVYN